MLLSDLLAQYIENHDYGVSPGHAKQLKVSLRAWGTFLGSEPTVADLTDERINGYLDWMRAHRKPDTCRTRRGNLLILWHWAFQESITDTAPRRVRKIRRVDRLPTAWTLEEIRSLIAAAGELTGAFHLKPWKRSAWWSSLIRAGYDTGLRLGDLLAIRSSEIRASMQILQHKTERWVHVSLRPATLAAIDQTLADGSRELVWESWCGEETFYFHFRRLVSTAGIRPGTFRWLRRTAATQLERLEPGRATELLGHASRSTTEAWYIDRSQLNTPPLPPL